MKRFLVVLALAAAAGATYVAAAPGGRRAAPTPRQFTALKKQVARLSKQVKALRKDVGTVQQLAVAEAAVLVDCVNSLVPVAQVGDGQGKTYGYSYTDSAANTFLTSALDWTTSSDPNAKWLVSGDSTCASEVNGSSGSIQHLSALAHGR